MKPVIYIGIDTGVNTGVAVWNSVAKQFVSIETLQIHRALGVVSDYVTKWQPGQVMVRVEDARQRKWFGNSGKEVLQGVGSVKRDAVIWEDYLKDIECRFDMVAPKNNKTKMNSKQFAQMTGWDEKTNEHNRDAAMLVFNL